MILLEPREILRIVGVVIFALGMVCLPVGYGANPKRDSSSYFLNLADSGQFFNLALILLLLGSLTFLISCIPIPFRRPRKLTQTKKKPAVPEET